MRGRLYAVGVPQTGRRTPPSGRPCVAGRLRQRGKNNIRLKQEPPLKSLLKKGGILFPSPF